MPPAYSQHTMNSTDNTSGNVQSLLNSDPVSAPDTATEMSAGVATTTGTATGASTSATTASGTSSLRAQIMRELDISAEPEASASAEVETHAYSTLVEARLLQRRREVETLRQGNLAALNTLVDKCIASDKFDAQSIRLLLETVVERKGSASGSSPVLLSPMGKKRRMHSPQYSRLSNGDLHTLHERGSGGGSGSGPAVDAEQQFQNVAQQYKLPPPQHSSGNNNNNNSQPGQWMYNQPYMYNGGNSSAGNLAPPAPLMGDPYGAAQGYMAPQGYPQAYPQGSYYGQQHPQQQPGMPSGAQSPYRPGASSGAAGRTRGSHRRTQSAIVSMPPSDMRSPGRAGNGGYGATNSGMPQRPVNFLIHTPKHPPPT